MSEGSVCPQCGVTLPANSPEGLCPGCLLKWGLATQTAAGSGRSGSASGEFAPPIPAELASRFPDLEILELVGRGGMGVVYKARQKRLDRLVALKILSPQVGRDPSFAERFAREARAMAMLNHPHIVAVYDFGQTGAGGEGRGAGDEGTDVGIEGRGTRDEGPDVGIEGRGARDGDGNLPSPIGRGEMQEPPPPAPNPQSPASRPLFYFLMEYVDGLSLRQLLDVGKLSPEEAMAIVPQICEALQYAHDHGVVHRDIKPENVLLDKEGRVKIADFGIAKLVRSEPRDFTLTASGQIVGTPQYMAPEQIERPLQVDHRADIYSLGVVFYQMLTGELPLGRFAPPSRKVQVDVRLDEVVLRALEKEPERRYQQASEIKTRIETIVTTADTDSVASAPDPARSTGIPPHDAATPSGAPSAASNAAASPSPAGSNSSSPQSWLPLVVRHNGQPMLNLRALVIRCTIGLCLLLFLAAGLLLCSRIVFSSIRRDVTDIFLLPSIACITIGVSVMALAMIIRIRRGFSTPLDQLPELPQAFSAPINPAGFSSSGRSYSASMSSLNTGVASGTPASDATATAAEMERLLERARSMVKGPAIGLLITGLLTWVVLFAAAVWITPAAMTDRDGASDRMVSVILGLMVYAIFIMTAALKMKRLQAYGLAAAAGVLAILVSPSSLLGLPIGIWAIVALSQPDVRAAFAETRRIAALDAPPARRRRGFGIAALSLCLAGIPIAILVSPAVKLFTSLGGVFLVVPWFVSLLAICVTVEALALLLGLIAWRTPAGKTAFFGSAFFMIFTTLLVGGRDKMQDYLKSKLQTPPPAQTIASSGTRTAPLKPRNQLPGASAPVPATPTTTAEGLTPGIPGMMRGAGMSEGLLAGGMGGGMGGGMLVRKPLSAYETAKITRGDIADRCVARVQIIPDQIMQVWPQVEGPIVSLGGDPQTAADPAFKGRSIDVNSPVEAGTLLAKIDPERYQARVEQEEAALRRAQAEVAKAKAILKQAEAKGESTEVAAASLEAANAAVEQGMVSLKQAKSDLARTEIKSPVRGIVCMQQAVIGQTVAPGPNQKSLFTIARNLMFDAEVPPAAIARLHEGDKVSFTVVELPNETFWGRAAHIRDQKVTVLFDNADNKLRPYMEATGDFGEIKKHENVLLAPSKALDWAKQNNMRGGMGMGTQHLMVKDPTQPDGTRLIDVAVLIKNSEMAEVSGPEVKEGLEVIVGERAETAGQPNQANKASPSAQPPVLP
jgi:serine/threonine protein kinase/multidrug efflux pump subunit AcrA (membrane-fusion protein)